MKGKLPPTGVIFLESKDYQWRILLNGLINKLETTALIEKEPNVKVKINLTINQIFPPENLHGQSICSTQTDLGENVAIGISRIREFLAYFLDKSIWLFMGYINGDESAPILIIYYEAINISIYTQKFKGEEIKDFFPNPKLN